jgi:tetratricopeptide (TPR) repeat protein
MSRLLVTCRYPFPLPENADRRLAAHHVGPLSLAETRKLVWRLPGLDRLKAGQLQRAYVDVGGHPRALEYLDALLRGGQARFDDITERLEDALADQRIDDPTDWLAEVEGDLDRALAETVTLAVNDVLLGQLLDRVDQMPLARRLLLGLSVYRRPVDEHGVAWQIAEEVTQPGDPERQERLLEFLAAMRAAQNADQQVTAERLGISQAEFAELTRELTEPPLPPTVVPAGLTSTLATLAELSLAAPSDPGDSNAGPIQPLWMVHRWTAAALARLAASSDLVETHRRAARYWRWRAQNWPQGHLADIADLLEARYHHQAAGDLDETVEVTELVCSQLDTWGAWLWEEQLCQETLALVPDRSRATAVFTHQLGMIALHRGDYDQALDWYRQALTIFEELGNRVNMAVSYHQLGIVAYWRGDYDQALDWYRQALTIREELGDRRGIATSYHELGMVAFRQEDYDQALDWYRQALTIFEELGNRPEMALSYHQLGIVAYLRGDDDQALDWHRQALTIREELGDRAGMASTMNQIGILLTGTGNPHDGLICNLQSLRVRIELGSPELSQNLRLLRYQQEVLGAQRFEQMLREEAGDQDSQMIVELLEQFPASE